MSRIQIASERGLVKNDKICFPIVMHALWHTKPAFGFELTKIPVKLNKYHSSWFQKNPILTAYNFATKVGSHKDSRMVRAVSFLMNWSFLIIEYGVKRHVGSFLGQI